MQKVIPKIKVISIPTFTGVISKGDKEKWAIICSTGRINAYRMAFAHGQGASSKDNTWDKLSHKHLCCGSKVGWRHKTDCFNAVKNAPDDLSDLKDLSEILCTQKH